MSEGELQERESLVESRPTVPRSVSVLLPVYNAERYVGEAVESVLGQSLADFELVIVDDGSTDRSREILEAYAAKDGRIRLLSRSNTGLVGALNAGLAVCRGQFIARMDADDVCLPRRLEVQRGYLEAPPECVAVGSRVALIDEDGDEIGFSKTRYLSHEQIDAAHLRGEFAIMHPTVMMRAAAVRAVGGYRDWPIGEDYDLWLRLAEVGELANLSEPLLRYRWVQSSYSHHRRNQTHGVRQQILAEAFQRRGREGEPPKLPEGSHVTPYQFERRCADKALAHGYQRTGRKHALRAFRQNPANLEAWQLVARACVGETLKATVRPVLRMFLG